MIIVSSNDVSIHLPEEYVGKKVFIEIKSEDEVKSEREKKMEELMNHFSVISITTKDLKFDRKKRMQEGDRIFFYSSMLIYISDKLSKENNLIAFF